MSSMLIKLMSRLATAKFLRLHSRRKKNNPEFPSGSSREKSKHHKLGITVQLQRADLSILNKSSCICWS